jgi:hypothetical protein
VILAIDAASTLGWACGEPGAIPKSGSVRLIAAGDPVKDLAASGASFVRELIRKFEPTLIVREAPLLPRFNGTSQAAAFVSQHLIHGAILAMAGLEGIADIDVAVSTWRKFYCGRATGNPASKRGVVKTTKQRGEDRLASKLMVLQRGILLGLLPKDCHDFDRADAVGLFYYSCARYSRFAPTDLVLFEQRAG